MQIGKTVQLFFFLVNQRVDRGNSFQKAPGNPSASFSAAVAESRND